MSENTLTGRSCETNRRAAKQNDTRRNRRVDARRRKMLQPCVTHSQHAQKIVDESSSQDFIKVSNKENNLSHDNL